MNEMINFTVYGLPYKEVSTALLLKYGDRNKSVNGFLEECSQVVVASFMEIIDENYEKSLNGPTECAGCGCKLTPENHTHVGSGCDDCVESACIQCKCCDMDHDLWYIADKWNIAIGWA